MRTPFLLLLLFACITSAFSQNTTIIFKAKPNTAISIEKETDNTNIGMFTDEIYTDSTGTCTYCWDVDDFQFVSCSFYDGGSISFPIIQGSHVTITHKGEWRYEYEGTDKKAFEFFDNRKEFNRLFMETSFFFPEESGYEDYSLFIENQYSILSNSLDSLAAENAISPKFSEITTNVFNSVVVLTAISTYKTKFLTHANRADSIKIEQKIDEILDKISPLIDSGEIFKYGAFDGMLGVYFTNKYRKLDEKTKDELLSKNRWANYLKPSKIGFLIAPEEIRYKLLSSEVLSNINNRDPRGNAEILAYIAKIRPQNLFLPYLKEKQDELLVSLNTADHSGIKYIENTINTFEDFSKVEGLNQKVLYIDIWATWCGPCIGEFKHKDKIHELLLNYKDIVPVFISLDEDKKDAAWKDAIKAFNLEGYHLRANKELVTYINETLYNGQGIGVPLFILLDKNGKILEEQLPYPGNIDKLKQVFDKYFDK